MLAGNIGAALPTGLGFSLGRAGAAAAAAAAAAANGCTASAANGAANVSSADGAANGAAGGQTAPPPPQQQQRHRLVVFQGDGGLQMTAQELGTFARFGSDAIVILVNNDGYLVERYLSPIPHSSEGRRSLVYGFVRLPGGYVFLKPTLPVPAMQLNEPIQPPTPTPTPAATGYNYLAPWDYAAVADAMCRNVPGGKYKVLKAASYAAARAALLEARDALAGHFVFIEAVVSSSDAAPAAGAMRRAFCGGFFAGVPLYRGRFEAEFGPDWAARSARVAAKRVMSESLAEAMAAAGVAASPRGSEDGGGGGGGAAGPSNGAAAAAAAPARRPMPTIDSTGSVASLAENGGNGKSGNGNGGGKPAGNGW